ncbi:MAG: DUF3108 domain-containing protein [bacterium]|nr:DUF3108 domain-containing protein [bacterium]
MSIKNKLSMTIGISLLWLPAFGFSAYSQDTPVDSTVTPARVVENHIFGQGEQFKYNVSYGIVPAGTAGFEITPDLVTYRGVECYNIHTWAYSAKSFDLFFKVRDEVHSYMDARGIFTWYFQKSLKEGRYHDVKIVDYDQQAGLAYTNDDGVPTDTSQIPMFVQDALSALYYFRLQPLEVGKSLYIQIHDIKKTYPMRIDVLGYETIDVPAGTFKCFKVEPVLESAGIFKSKGRIFLWFTDDEYRIPVLMKTKVLIGSIVAYLKEWKKGTPILFEK